MAQPKPVITTPRGRPLDAIVFHVGAGSYLEHHALQAAFAEGPRTVAYGATDLASPEAFLTELLELGEAL